MISRQHIYIKKIGTGPLLVMLHGWGMYSGVFSHVVSRLSHYFTVVLVDLPGFGKSNILSPHEYELDNLTTAVSEILDEPAFWLGWSLGGLVATNIALKYPTKIRSLILVATTPCFIANENWPGIPKDVFESFYRNLSHDYKKTVNHFITLQLFQSPNYKTQLLQVKEILARVHVPNEMALKSSFNLLREIDLRAEITHIQCPVLALYGRLDALVPIKVEEKMRYMIPRIETHVFQRASHMPFLSHPDEFIELILHVL